MIFFQSAFTERTPFVLDENHALTATAAASSSVAGFPPSAVTAENTFQAWRCNAAEGSITLDFGAARDFDTLAAVGHNLANLGVASTFGHKLNAVDAWTDLASFEPPDSRPAVLVASAKISARYVRLAVPAGSAVPPSVSALVIGARRKLPAWVLPSYVRAADAETVEGEAAISRGGNYLGATVKHLGGRLAVQLSPMDRAWVDANLPAFRAHYARRRPFLWASSPTDYPADVAYCWRADGAPELRADLMGGGGHVRFGMELDFHVA